MVSSEHEHETEHEISSGEEVYAEEDSPTLTSTIVPYETIRIAGYADITKFESFYGNPDKNNTYLPTAKANNDAKNWLFQVGRFMKIAKTPEYEKVNAVTTKLQGLAHDWLVHLTM
ncbi:hypothetical protein C6P40_004278 [Pichia californica]|uniref:Uncharacterized protein n=1 Tax=Pichia californica TaxID=460514 RepID=A0A9P7BEH4_9ASCO|nr:hypothetical protein C6P40_004278 [[Candida] californica]